MKKRKNFILILSVTLASLTVFVLFMCLYPRLFGNAETKAIIGIKDIAYSYVKPHAKDLVDLVHHTFPGSYDYEDNSLYVILGYKTDEDLFDVLSEIEQLNIDIQNYISSDSILSDSNTKVEIYIEKWADWSITLKPKSNYICTGLGYNMSLTDTLQKLKSFDEIYLGGYWGFNITVPDDINEDFFTGFDELKALKIDDVHTEEMAARLNEAVDNLRSKGVEVIIELRRSY